MIVRVVENVRQLGARHGHCYYYLSSRDNSTKSVYVKSLWGFNKQTNISRNGLRYLLWAILQPNDSCLLAVNKFVLHPRSDKYYKGVAPDLLTHNLCHRKNLY